MVATPGLALAADGGFILAGQRTVSGEYTLVRTDGLGITQWGKFYDAGSIQGLYSVMEDLDGDIVASGIYTMRTDATGAFEWARIHVGGGGNVNSVAQSGDGGLIATGEGSNGSPAGGYNIVVTKLAADGSFVTGRRFGGPGLDFGYAVAATTDGGASLTGGYEGTVDFGAGPVSGR